MMHLTGFDLFAWAGGFIGHVVLLFVLLVRGRARSFPFFTAYIAEQILSTSVAYFIFYHDPFRVYQTSFWGFEGLEEILQLCVFYEIALHVFRPTGVWAQDVKKTLLSLVAVSVVVDALLTWLAQPETPRVIQRIVLRSNLFAALLMSELLVGMVVLSATVGLPWKTHVSRIAHGVGIYSIVSVAVFITDNFIGIHRGDHTGREIERFRYLVYLVCEVYWIVMLWAEAPAPRELPAAMKMQIYTLNRQVENDLRRIRTWRQH